jgi:hypothetical protein
MRGFSKGSVIALAVAWLAAPAVAQEMFVYPQKGQTKDQQEKDEFDCYRWARDQTGFDPMEVPRTTSAPPERSGPGVGGSAVRGAAVGGAVGKITGRGGGKGLAAGAAAGGLIGGMRRSDQAAKEDRWAQDETRKYAQRRQQYNRAYAACLEGRGYTVR